MLMTLVMPFEEVGDARNAEMKRVFTIRISN